MLQKVIIISYHFEIFCVLYLMLEDFYVESLKLFVLSGRVQISLAVFYMFHRSVILLLIK